MMSASLLVCVVATAGLAAAASPYVEGHVSQPTWWNEDRREASALPASFSQRYLRNSTFATSKSSPIFLMVGGENRVEDWWGILGGQVTALALQHQAHMVAVEHRGFGSSQPIPLNLSDLSYMDPAAAALDIRHFVKMLQEGKVANDIGGGPVILFGCSYSALVSAYAQQNLAPLDSNLYSTHSVASSAPIRPTVDFSVYHQGMAHAFADPDAHGCPGAGAEAINAGIVEAAKLVHEGPTGWQQLAKAWNNCEELRTEDDARTLWKDFVDNTIGSQAVQESYGVAIPVLCRVMANLTASGVDPVTALGMWKALTAGGKAPCMDDTFDGFVSSLRDATQDPDLSDWGRQYFRLKCFHMGWMHECKDEGSCPYAVAGGPMTEGYFDRVCADTFSDYGNGSSEPLERTYQGSARLGSLFGGDDSMPAEAIANRTLFVAGSDDPWTALTAAAGALNGTSKVVEIAGGWHCADMGAASPYDSPSLRAARQRIADQVAAWLAEA